MNKYTISFKRLLKKNRFQFTCFIFIIIISAILMNIGLTAVIDYNNNVKSKYENDNVSDANFVIPSQAYNENLKSKIVNTDGVEDVEVRDSYFIRGTVNGAEAEDVSVPSIIFNRDHSPIYNNFVVQSSEEEPSDSNNIYGYVSYWYKQSYNFKLGDTLSCDYEGRKYNFVISGFVEDMVYGNNNCLMTAIYLSDENYSKFERPDYSSSLATKSLAVDGKNRDSSEALYKKCIDTLSGINGLTLTKGTYYTQLYQYRTALVNTLAIMIVLFAFVITIISLFICGFRIKNGILEDIEALGTMKSLGYNSNQIRLSFAFPYVLLCILSSFAGIGVSFLVLPFFNTLIEKISGIIYSDIISPVPIIITMAVLVLTVVVTIALATRKIKKLTPVVALQSGIEHHNFKHNSFPIESSHGPVDLTLGRKNFVSLLSHNISLFIVLTVLTFLVIFGFSGYYNINLNTIKFIDTINEQYCNIDIISKQDNLNYKDKIEKVEGVNKAVFFDDFTADLDSKNAENYVCEDFSRLNNNMFYKGRAPQHDNEIAIGSAYEKDYKIGQTVKLTVEHKSSEYLVVGFLQTPNQLGKSTAMTIDGYKRIKKDYMPCCIYVYTNIGVNTETCMESIKNEVPGLLRVCNNDKMLESSLGTYVTMTSILATTIFIVVLIITALILFIIFSTFIIQNKTIFGILKALGYTSKRIVFQSVLGLFPSIFFGVGTGCVLAAFFIPDFWLIVLSSMQLRLYSLNVPIPINIITGIILTLCSLVISVLLITKSIKRISPTKLISE